MRDNTAHATENLRRADLLARYDLGYFTERVFGTVSPNDLYEHTWHVDCIAEHLRAVERGELRRLIVNMPPRMMKSISISIAWPAWLLGQNPKEQIVVASYTKELALDLSVKCRDVLRSDWYGRIFPGTVLKSDQDEKGKFATSLGGQRFATGVNGTLTGMGGQFLICDDPLNPELAASDVERKKANDWVSSTFLNRFNDRRTGSAVLVMQRLHADDTTGRLLEMGGWEHLCLPGMFEKRTIIEMGGKKWEKQAGECLDEKRFGKAVLEQTLREYGDPLKYAAQVQQNPTPDEGAFFRRDWMKWYEEEPEGMRYYGSSDFAVTSEGGDFTVHGIMGVCPLDNWYMIDMWRGQEESHVWSHAMVDMIEDWKPLEWLEEKGAIEKAVDPLISKIMQERKIYCYRRKVASVHDKVTRAQTLRGRMAAGKVFFPKNKPWISAVLKEVLEFPNSKHDDIVDMLTLFGRMVHTMRRGEMEIKPRMVQEKPTWNDVMQRHFRKMKQEREEAV